MHKDLKDLDRAGCLETKTAAPVRGDERLGALSIQQKFRFEISEISRAQWNGTFRLHRPDPSHRAFCDCGFSAHS